MERMRGIIGSDLNGRAGRCRCGFEMGSGTRVTGGLGKRLVLMAKSVSGGIGPTRACHVTRTLVRTNGSFSVLIVPKTNRKCNSTSRCFRGGVCHFFTGRLLNSAHTSC